VAPRPRSYLPQVSAVLGRYKKKSALDRALSKCAAPLLRLRQACCHPQIGAGGVRSNENRIMSM
jgi:hypothetical protein